MTPILRCGRWTFLIAAIAVMELISAKVLCAADPVLQIRIRAPRSESDVAHGYFRELLALALEKTADEYGPAKVVVTSLNITQNRALSYLNKSDHINIDWAGTNKERETTYRPIRVPLNLGLLGYRMLAISKEKKGYLIRSAPWPN